MSGNRLWVLGAADVEMAAIERLLTEAGERIVFAAVDGKRCHGGNAYKSNSVIGDGPTDGWGPEDTVYLVECDLPGWWCGDPQPAIVRIDHHRPGDPGYGRPPEEFLSASSIGQVIAALHQKEWQVRDGRWSMDISVPGFASDLWMQARREWLMVAAADHCLEAAYRRKCPGVDPDDLMRFRAQVRAEFRKVPVKQVVEEIEAATARLWEGVLCEHCGGTGDEYGYGCTPTEFNGEYPPCYACGGKTRVKEYADFTRHDPIPELPEAACRTGIPYLASVTEPGGRRKVTLGAASPELVRRFVAGELVSGLVDYYGDPARGFAGGYLT